MFPICNSAYSLGFGVSSANRLCQQARKLGYQQICIADQNNLYGLPDFIIGARRNHIRPIIGAAINSSDESQTIICLVKNNLGYSNLCRLLSRRHCHPNFDLVSALVTRHQGIIGLGDTIDVIKYLRLNGMEAYINLGMVPKTKRQKLQQQAKQQELLTCNLPHCGYATNHDQKTYLLLRTIQQKKTIHEQQRHTPFPREMVSPICTTQQDSINKKISTNCRFTGPPQDIIMPPYQTQEQRSAHQELQERATSGANTRYGSPPPPTVKKRLEYELSIIKRMDFSSYFLVVQDIVRTRGKNGKFRRICGRGSGAASLVAYCLYITNTCPVKHNLYFERFLHPGRQDPPDIDIDFAWDERQAVLDEVFVKYKRHIAMVCNHVFYQPKMAIREIAKAYGLPEHEITKVTGNLHWLNQSQQEGQANALAPPWPAILNDARRIIGLPRHLSVHPGGIIITPKPISHYVPIQYSMHNIPLIQWQKDGAEFFGLVKIDILGNRSLGVIRDAIAHIEARGVPFSTRRWNPEDDPATQLTISCGQTMGCFYIESPAMRLLQRKAGTGDFEQTVIQSSIIRPAANEFTREYIRRLHGGSWSHLHPSLAEVLNESFGLMVYQEDVSRVAVALAGFSHERADGLRKIMSKKDKTRRLRDYELEFHRGAARRGIAAETIQEIWRMIMSFSGYSFCKPHSASYAKVSFQAAYLKTHYPAEFMASVLGNQGGYYSTFAYISEAKRLGILIKSPCVNQSQSSWTAGKQHIRPGLLAVRGVSKKTCEKIIQKRHNMPFTSMIDFLTRGCPNQKEAIALVHAGATDGLSQTGNRSVLLWDVAHFFYLKKTARQFPETNTTLLSQHIPAPSHLPPPKLRKKSRREFKTLGFLTKHHPLSLCISAKQKRISSKNIHQHWQKEVTIAGWLIAGKLVRTKKGDPMEFLSFEDETGVFETTFFPGVYKKYGLLLQIGRPYLIKGRVDEDFGASTIIVTQIQRLG